MLTTYAIVQSEYSSLSRVHKVACPYCNKKYLPPQLKIHHKFFCGPNAQRSAALSKTDKKKPTGAKPAGAGGSSRAAGGAAGAGGKGKGKARGKGKRGESEEDESDDDSDEEFVPDDDDSEDEVRQTETRPNEGTSKP